MFTHEMLREPLSQTVVGIMVGICSACGYWTRVPDSQDIQTTFGGRTKNWSPGFDRH